MQRRVCMGGARVWIISKRNEISDALFIHRARYVNMYFFPRRAFFICFVFLSNKTGNCGYSRIEIVEGGRYFRVFDFCFSVHFMLSLPEFFNVQMRCIHLPSNSPSLSVFNDQWIFRYLRVSPSLFNFDTLCLT